MKIRRCVILLLITPLALVAAPLKTLEEFQKLAAPFGSEIRVPVFPVTPEQIDADKQAAIAAGNSALDRIARQDPKTATFENTFGALDQAGYEANLSAGRIEFMQQSHPVAAVRDAAENASKEIQQWSVGTQYREDVYAAIKGFAATKPSLAGEDRRLFNEILRDYRRAGLDLPPAERKVVENLRKQLSGLETDFSANIVKTRFPLVFTKAELAGVPETFLTSPGVKTGDDAYTILVNVTSQRQIVQTNCSVEETRRRVTTAEYALAKDINIPLLNQIVALRADIARKLGYGSWNDYMTEVKMAKNGATAKNFIEELVRGIQPKFEAEVAGLQKMKAAETNDPQAKIELWDWRYYQSRFLKENYTIDAEALRVYFPYGRVLEGMFAIYQSIFGLKFEEIEPPFKWVGEVALWGVRDAKTGEPLGLFYLDMFPREGKYNHFAQFSLQPGKQLPNGSYLRPTVALLCNFPPPANGAPSLLNHREVETLFHEFGHCMHSILTRAKRAQFSGTNVPGDFVEAPSQMLESWTFDKSVLDTFAADYRDPSKKIPAEILNKMKEARLAGIAVFYRRQFSFGLLDLALHGPHEPGAAIDSAAISNRILSEVFFPVPPDTAFAGFFGHLVGYSGGYYGYAWADAIAEDMATVFENSPRRYFDPEAGIRLRNEIYAQGNARDVKESIEKFLGRKQSNQPFFRKLGLEAEGKVKTAP
ncbi:MAG TPA: M3 family metallopeptidase [Opitutaceae bacterium]|nr:M3 family metallopeptidase [Opitutaceae bacterium]